MGSHSRWHSGNLNKGRAGVWGEWYREREKLKVSTGIPKATAEGCSA